MSKVDDRAGEGVVANHPVQGNLCQGGEDHSWRVEHPHHVAVRALRVHPVRVHELDRSLSHRLHWAVHLMVRVKVKMIWIVVMLVWMMDPVMELYLLNCPVKLLFRHHHIPERTNNTYFIIDL